VAFALALQPQNSVSDYTATSRYANNAAPKLLDTTENISYEKIVLSWWQDRVLPPAESGKTLLDTHHQSDGVCYHDEHKQ
jgi:hypothetical protein